LAVDPFGMERRSFACGRELQRAIRQTLIEPSTDRLLYGSESPRDRGVIDTEQPRSRAQCFSATNGEDIAKIVPIENLHFCRHHLQQCAFTRQSCQAEVWPSRRFGDARCSMSFCSKTARVPARIFAANTCLLTCHFWRKMLHESKRLGRYERYQVILP